MFAGTVGMNHYKSKTNMIKKSSKCQPTRYLRFPQQYTLQKTIDVTNYGKQLKHSKTPEKFLHTQMHSKVPFPPYLLQKSFVPNDLKHIKLFKHKCFNSK